MGTSPSCYIQVPPLLSPGWSASDTLPVSQISTLHIVLVTRNFTNGTFGKSRERRELISGLNYNIIPRAVLNVLFRQLETLACFMCCEYGQLNFLCFILRNSKNAQIRNQFFVHQLVKSLGIF